MKRLSWGGVLLALLAGVQPAAAAVWKSSGQIGLTVFYAEMNDAHDPVTVLLRVENKSRVEKITVTRYFVQMTDGDNQPLRQVSGDEVVSGYLQRLRVLMPEHAREIDNLMSEIQADFPQQKIVEVYARLKSYMDQGRPIGWRVQLENFLLGKKESKNLDLNEAENLIEQIGLLSKNYFWPNDIAPGTVVTGVIYFTKPVKVPANIYFQFGEQFLGTKMAIAASDEKSRK